MTETPPPYERVLAQTKPACDACGAALSARHHRGGWDVENEVCLTLSGGYGSFVDTAISDHNRYSYLLCEACALRLCRSLGLQAPVREHHTSTVCECPDRPVRDSRGFPTPCRCAYCTT